MQLKNIISFFLVAIFSWPLLYASSYKSLAPAVHPDDDEKPLSGSMALMTNYIFRGISQTNNLPAVQGSLTYTFLTTGIFLNLFASNAYEIDTLHNDDIGTIEIDEIIGIANKIGHFNYDIDFDHYSYPKANGLSYNELNSFAGYEFPTGTTLTGKFSYSKNVYNVHKPGYYYEGDITQTIPARFVYFDNVSVTGAIGHYSLPRSEELYSYNNYLLGIQKVISIYTLALQWTGTNGRARLDHLDDNYIVGSVLANFS